MLFFKVIKNTILILLTLSIIAVPVLIFFVKFDNKTFLGEMAKSKVLKNYKLVEILNLNEPGDARYSYFDHDKKSVSVSVFTVNFKESNESVDLWIEDMISQTINKYTVVSGVNNLTYTKTKLLTDADLNELRKRAVLHENTDLYLIYTSSYAEKESSVGLVLHRDTIFIFRDALDALSERENTKEILEKTTIMHEWGHLLGMGHVNDGGCIMDEKVDVYDYPPIGGDLPTRYCDKELQLIKKLH